MSNYFFLNTISKQYKEKSKAETNREHHTTFVPINEEDNKLYKCFVLVFFLEMTNIQSNNI